MTLSWLALALDQAQMALPHCPPNPAVGCTLVDTQGRVIGWGHTQAVGHAHAEVMALRHAQTQGYATQGCTAWVTLEPCAHTGRTPPCCDALIAAGVARVVVAMQDPNPLVAGQGLARLRAAGVCTEVLDPATPEATFARDVMRGFLSRMQRQRPWLRLKMASSVDGITALPNGHSQWITGAAAREDVQSWRARASALLTAIGTILADNPLLNVRLQGLDRQPDLWIADRRLRTPLNARLWGVPARSVHILTHAEMLSTPQAKALQAQGAHLHIWSGWLAWLKQLHSLETNEVHIEAGATLSGNLLAHPGLVDELLLYQAPILLGAGHPMAHTPPLHALPRHPSWYYHEVTHLSPDLRMILRPKTTEPIKGH